MPGYMTVKYIKIVCTAGETKLTCGSVFADSAERTDAPSREGDGEGTQPELPATETTIRGYNPKTSGFHRPGTCDANCGSR